ncbi:MAG: hypothetical protein R3B09_26530 [Nannocystaceae bacterium]
MERRATWTREEAGLAVDALAVTARGAIERHFPSSAGYRTESTLLHGFVDGIRLSVTRGAFRAVVSAHYYVEDRGAGEGGGCSLRMIAAAEERAPRRRRSAGQQAAIGLAILGVVVVVIAALGASGLWGYFRLSLLLSFWIMMTPALAWLSAADPEPALGAPVWPSLPPSTDDLERWQRILAAMTAEREILSDPRALPFRR